MEWLNLDWLRSLLTTAGEAGVHEIQIRDGGRSLILSLSDREAKERQIFEIVRSPMLGTYYRSPTPNAAPFIEVGEPIRAGQAIALIESMKLMNEIESDVSGVVIDIHVRDGQTVEIGQPLITLACELGEIL